MKAKLIVNNQEIEVEISEEEYKKLQPDKKKTGYEKADVGNTYWYIGDANELTATTVCDEEVERKIWGDDACWHSSCDIYNLIHTRYNAANYYSSKEVAENNARADKLMRQLRRFAVEHREKEINWNDKAQDKYHIYYHHYNKCICTEINYSWHYMYVVYFDSKETAQLAIDTFHDELMWYFTEYKDSL